MLAYKETDYNKFSLYLLVVEGQWCKLEWNFEPAFIARLLVHWYHSKFPYEDKNVLKLKLLMLEKMPDSVKAEINKVNYDNLVSIDEFLIALGEDDDTEVVWDDVFSNHIVGNSERYLIWVDEVRQSGLKLITEPSQINQVFPDILVLFCKCKLAELYLKEKIDLVLFWKQIDEIDNLVKDLDSKNFNKIKELATNLVE